MSFSLSTANRTKVVLADGESIDSYNLNKHLNRLLQNDKDIEAELGKVLVDQYDTDSYYLYDSNGVYSKIKAGTNIATILSAAGNGNAFIAISASVSGTGYDLNTYSIQTSSVDGQLPIFHHTDGDNEYVNNSDISVANVIALSSAYSTVNSLSASWGVAGSTTSFVSALGYVGGDLATFITVGSPVFTYTDRTYYLSDFITSITGKLSGNYYTCVADVYVAIQTRTYGNPTGAYPGETVGYGGNAGVFMYTQMPGSTTWYPIHTHLR